LPGVMVSIQKAQHLQLSSSDKAQEGEEMEATSPVHSFKRLVTEDLMPTDSFKRLVTEDLMPGTDTCRFERLCTEESWPVYDIGGNLKSYAEAAPQVQLTPHASQLAQQIQLAQLVHQVVHPEQVQPSKPEASPTNVVPPPAVPVAADGARIRRRPRRRGRGNAGEVQVGDGSPSTGSLGHPLHCGKACGYFHREKGCRDGANCPNCHICWPSEGSKGHPLECKQACKYNLKAKGCRDGSSCKCCHLCTWSREADLISQSDGSESTRTS